MVQCNFVDNVLREGNTDPIQEEVIQNSELIADMATSPEFGHRYISNTEISIGAGYTIRLEDEQKNLYKDGCKVEPAVTPATVISAITQSRGGYQTTRVGSTISSNYGIHMSPDRSFQFYKRVFYPESVDDEEGKTISGSSTQHPTSRACCDSNKNT